MVAGEFNLKVLHIIVGLNVGGAELMLKRLILSKYPSDSYEHQVVSLTSLGVIGAQLRDEGITVNSLGMRGIAGIPSVLFKLIMFIRKLKPDVVQTWMYHADLLGGLAARAAGVRNVIWGIRTTNVGRGGKRSTLLIRKLCAKLSRWIPIKIVCAAEASRRAHVAIGYAERPMLVIPNGFDLSCLKASVPQRDSIRKAYKIDDDETVIGSLGRYNAVKDQANFIAAASLLAAQYSSLTFLMVGRDVDKSNTELINLITASGFSERFILLGERQDVTACLNAMDIFCVHSRTEGFPNVLGEAMAVGIPCVSTDVGDAALLLGEYGIIVPSQNSKALAEGLAKMIDLPMDSRSDIVKKARARIEKNFTLDRTSGRFHELYSSLVNG